MGNPNIPRLDPGGTRFGTASTGGPTPGHKCLGRFKVCGSGVESGLLRMIEDYFPIPTFFKVGIQPLGGSCWITWRARISFRSLFFEANALSQRFPGDARTELLSLEGECRRALEMITECGDSGTCHGSSREHPQLLIAFGFKSRELYGRWLFQGKSKHKPSKTCGMELMTKTMGKRLNRTCNMAKVAQWHLQGVWKCSPLMIHQQFHSWLCKSENAGNHVVQVLHTTCLCNV